MIEARTDSSWEQLRIAHLSALGETTKQMGITSSDDLIAGPSVEVGIYACSPGNSQFEAKFRQWDFAPSLWAAHEG